MKVTSWNIEGRLSRYSKARRRGSPEHIIKEIKRLDSDILFLPEAFDVDKGVETEIRDRLKDLGYMVYVAKYDDSGERKYAAVSDPAMMLLSRHEVSHFEEIRPGDIRTMLVADVYVARIEQSVRVFGIHLDDRNEAGRLRQVEGLLPLIATSPSPAVVMGDFNAMHSDSIQAWLLRSRIVRGVISHFPHRRTKDVLQRLSEMALGETLKLLESESGLERTDRAGNPTITPKMRGQEWMPSIPIVQIDHIFVTSEITLGGFSVHSDGGSDHRAISVRIEPEQSQAQGWAVGR